jgi:hypothetical protein
MLEKSLGLVERYCIYCKYGEIEIRKENKQFGYRLPCKSRDTKEGFHRFGIRCKKCKQSWRRCTCK